ncbi:hypothetical protein NL676_031295 [Syzygium grande]|nr:hypothetical protein NL676_031295 [Syzygium grande]
MEIGGWRVIGVDGGDRVVDLNSADRLRFSGFLKKRRILDGMGNYCFVPEASDQTHRICALEELTLVQRSKSMYKHRIPTAIAMDTFRF